MKLKHTLSLLAFGLVIAAGSATAGTLAPCDAFSGNLVTNCGFETGLTGWTVFGAFDNSGVGSSSPSGTLPNSGANLAFFGQVGATGGISQNIPTVAGNSYDLAFYLQNDGGSTTSFSVSWDGTVVYSEGNAGAYGFTLFEFDGLQASTASTPVAFTFRQDPAWYSLDDVTVADAPEPGAMGLLGGGLTGLALMLRRRKRA